jgi:hypothetical protein
MLIASQSRAYGKNRWVIQQLRVCWERGEYTVFVCGGFVSFKSRLTPYAADKAKARVFQGDSAGDVAYLHSKYPEPPYR